MEKTGHYMPNLFDATTVPVLQERAEDWFTRADLNTLLLAILTTARDACGETDRPRITEVLENLRTWENTPP